MQLLASCAETNPLPNLEVNARKQLNLHIFFQFCWHLLVNNLACILFGFHRYQLIRMNAANFAGSIAHLFDQTYDCNSTHTTRSLRGVNTFTWQPKLDSGSSWCLIQSCTHSLTWQPPQSLATPWLSAAISDASTLLWPFLTTIANETELFMLDMIVDLSL